MIYKVKSSTKNIIENIEFFCIMFKIEPPKNYSHKEDNIDIPDKFVEDLKSGSPNVYERFTAMMKTL